MKSIVIKGKKIDLPAFFPDATRGVIRSVDAQDLKNAGVRGLVMNTYHLLSQPGPSVIKLVGGLKAYTGWDGHIITDSGGFQMFSIIQKNKSLGTITKDAVTFHLSSKGGRQKYKITPEKCIQIQFDLNSDIMVVLDYFTPHKASDEMIKTSVDITLDWAKRCKAEFEKQCKQRGFTQENRPHLFAVVQGAHNKKERKRCAEGLIKVGFDGYGYGGWPFDENDNFDLELTEYIASLLPKDKPKYALGVGNPQAIVDSVRLGWNLFDCVLPTRDARHKRLYVFSKDPNKIENIFTKNKWYEYLYIAKEKMARDNRPISPYCDCHTCKNYSRAYLRHLFAIEDALAWRLATIHNLRFYQKLMEMVKTGVSN